MAPGDHQLVFAEIELTRPLTRHPVPLTTGLRTESPGPSSTSWLSERNTAPETFRASLTGVFAPRNGLIRGLFCHDEMVDGKSLAKR